MSHNLDITIRDGRCKVIEGAARRVLHTTEESLGLYLLRLNPATAANTSNVRWLDMLATRGIAIATVGDRMLALQTFPAELRTIAYVRGDARKDHKVVPPEMLMATAFREGRLQKATLWAIKPGHRERLTPTTQDNVLAYYPFGNVYNHGGICWGTTPIRDISTPQEAFDAFFNSGFNGDLFAHGGGAGGLQPMLAGLGSSHKFPEIASASFTKSVASVAQEIARI